MDLVLSKEQTQGGYSRLEVSMGQQMRRIHHRNILATKTPFLIGASTTIA